jgi:nucleoside phosphorylase
LDSDTSSFTDSTPKEEIGMPEGGSHSRCAVILTAIQVEYQAVRAHLTDVLEDVDHLLGTVYERGTFLSQGGVWDVGIVEVGAGIADAALAADRAINHFNPILVIFVGIAGGLKDVVVGDIVAATKVYGYASGKAKTTFETRPDVSNSTFRMVQRARAEARREDWLLRLIGSVPHSTPHVYVAPIASGDQVVASTDSDLYHFLCESYSDAIAVEMEGHGFLHAIQAHPQVNALIIRGISDLIDGKGESGAKDLQEVAARHAAAFAFEILAKLEIVTPQNPQEVGVLVATGEWQGDGTNPREIIIEGGSEPLSAEAFTNRLLNEFRNAIPEHSHKVKRIVDSFDGGRDLCRSAIKWLDSLDEEVRRICEDAPTMSFLDQGRLQNIRGKISVLKSDLEPFRRLRLWITSRQRREDESRCEQIRHGCRTLLTDLDQFRRQRSLETS